MTQISQDKASQRARDLFNKGFAAFERGSLDYAVEALSSCVRMEPRFLQARKFLRAAELQRAPKRKSGGMNLLSRMQNVQSLPAYMAATMKLRQGKVDEALQAAEDLLRDDPLNMKHVDLFVEAAVAADAPEAAIDTLELVKEHYPKDLNILNTLGALSIKVGDTRGARQYFEKLCELAPNDPDAVKRLKDAMALDSISSDGWEKAGQRGGYRDIMKDEKQATTLEKDNKAVKSDTDTDALIEETLRKIEAEPQNVNYLRALARLHTQRKDYPKAVETLQKALEKNPGDPELDNQLASTRLQQFAFDAVVLREAGDAAGAAAKEEERRHFEFENMQDRVKRYPNDLRLRYEWGVLLHDNEYTNEAIQQFQLAQRQPKYRLKSLYYMALCFKHKHQYDLAVDQLETANAELPIMDDTKKDVLYELGVMYEAIGNREKAAQAYKQVYQFDIGYKDIAQKIEGIYKKPG
jgi:tetratricopeptide (TPR) repeat protein